VQALAEAVGGDSKIISDVGHTIPIEAPQTWRDAVVSFLDDAQSP